MMQPFHCLVVNDTGGYICWQNSTVGFRIGWDNTDPGMFGSFGASFTCASRHLAFTFG